MKQINITLLIIFCLSVFSIRAQDTEEKELCLNLFTTGYSSDSFISDLSIVFPTTKRFIFIDLYF
jgi:hypothetical protein